MREREKKLEEALRELLPIARDMLAYIEGYAEIAERDDPVHEMLPRYRDTIARAAIPTKD